MSRSVWKHWTGGCFAYTYLSYCKTLSMFDDSPWLPVIPFCVGACCDQLFVLRNPWNKIFLHDNFSLILCKGQEALGGRFWEDGWNSSRSWWWMETRRTPRAWTWNPSSGGSWRRLPRGWIWRGGRRDGRGSTGQPGMASIRFSQHAQIQNMSWWSKRHQTRSNTKDAMGGTEQAEPEEDARRLSPEKKKAKHVVQSS